MNTGTLVIKIITRICIRWWGNFNYFGDKRRLEYGRSHNFCINVFNMSLALELEMFCG